MTEAGDRTLCRETTAQHIETGITVTVTNAGTHLQQRDRALVLLSGKLGIDVSRNECTFDFKVVEIKD
jgi:protein subunit release factor A